MTRNIARIAPFSENGCDTSHTGVQAQSKFIPFLQKGAADDYKMRHEHRQLHFYRLTPADDEIQYAHRTRSVYSVVSATTAMETAFSPRRLVNKFYAIWLSLGPYKLSTRSK